MTPGTDRPDRSTDSTGASSVQARVFRPPWWVRARAGKVTWWVRPEWRDALVGERGLRLDEWRGDGKLATVKQGPHRVVYRADLPQGSVYVKHFLVPDARAMLRQWFRRGKGRNEGRRAAKLDAIGVPTITPLALGEERRGKFLFENYLITAAIVGTVPLDEFVERWLPRMSEPERGRVRRALAVALGELTARLHDAGFLHADFHPGNLLVRLDDFGQPRLAMIDLDALRVRRAISWSDARANLALLNHYFWLRSARADRYRFLRAYLRARGVAPPDRRAFAKAIEQSTRRWAERLWTRWGRRCRGTNKYFAVHRAPGAWGVAARDLDPDTLETWMADPDAPFRQPGVVILKDSRTTTVAEIEVSLLGRRRPAIYKRFRRKKWLDPILSLFRPSRGWRAWQAGQHLASRAVPSPRNLAFLARLGRGAPWWPGSMLPRDTYVVTLKAEPATTLSDYVRKQLPAFEPAETRARVRTLRDALAQLIRTLHERSLSHRDLKAANILIEGDPAAAEPRLSLIDLVGVDLLHPLPRHRRIQNLARLHLSLEGCPGRTRTDSLRFLRLYLAGPFLPHEPWKAIWRDVVAAADRKRQQNDRRGRLLS